MSGNAEDREMGAGTSKHMMSVEEEAREHNKKFWEEEEAAAGAAGYEGGREETTNDYGTTDGQEDDTTDGGDHGPSGSGTNPTAGKKTRKARQQPRKPQVLANVTDEFTLVSPSGLPLEPAKLAKGFSMQIGCIVRESVSINTKDIRSEENAALLQTMVAKLHQRYKFPDEDSKRRAEGNAITKMSTSLASWRFRVKKKINKGDS